MDRAVIREHLAGRTIILTSKIKLKDFFFFVLKHYFLMQSQLKNVRRDKILPLGCGPEKSRFALFSIFLTSNDVNSSVSYPEPNLQYRPTSGTVYAKAFNEWWAQSPGLAPGQHRSKKNVAVVASR